MSSPKRLDDVHALVTNSEARIFYPGFRRQAGFCLDEDVWLEEAEIAVCDLRT